jgi:hypothetical protein
MAPDSVTPSDHPLDTATARYGLLRTSIVLGALRSLRRPPTADALAHALAGTVSGITPDLVADVAAAAGLPLAAPAAPPDGLARASFRL